MPLFGTVNARREAILPLTVHGPAGAETLDALIDTGFDGGVLLPRSVATRIHLPVVTAADAALADGTVVRLEVAMARVDWLGRRQNVLMYLNPVDETLLGTELLAAHRLVIDYPAALVEVT